MKPSKKAILCGRDAASLVGGASPFSDSAFVGWYDGPTFGAVRCCDGLEAYRFEMLAMDSDGKYDREAWDRGEEIRIFSLASLPKRSSERLSNILSQPEFRNAAAAENPFLDEVNSLLDSALPPEVVIAASGINATIRAARSVNEEEATRVQDWFSFLGLQPAKEASQEAEGNNRWDGTRA